MKHLLSLILVVAVTSFASAHKYYFAFAEVEYNSFTQRLEATITVTTHDLENVINGPDAIPKVDLDEVTGAEIELLEEALNKGFQIMINGEQTLFHLVGSETSLQGTTNFYIESDEIAMDSKLDIVFNLLMAEYPEQQNKVTFFYKKKMYTRTFTQGTRKQIIEIEEE